MIELFGTLATVLFVAATVFQARKSHLDGHAESISHGTVWSWTIGLGSMLYYVTAKFGFDLILFLNYGGQLFFVLWIARYKYFPRIRSK